MRLETRLRSTAMRALASPGFAAAGRALARISNRLRGVGRGVHYFHQADDPYSHLAVQKLDQLRDAYAIPFHTHLVSKPADDYLGNAERFDAWALNDARSIAADYGCSLPVGADRIDPVDVDRATAHLATKLGTPGFASAAIAAGEALWEGNPNDLPNDAGPAGDVLAAGNALRRQLGHYLGAMFCYNGEWYWGVDRIRLLEARLAREGYRQGTTDMCVPEPRPADATGLDAAHITLEYFPSLRSPYTAVGHPAVLDLIARSGVRVAVRPVMPMLMRGVPAPRSKQRYIITDAAREARYRGVPFGRMVDPFGEPVRRAFSCFPGAASLGKDMAFVTAYLRAAWADGVDISNEAGLAHVAAAAGIDWSELQGAQADTHWEAVLDENLRDMLDAGLWGVPSFRVTGGDAPAFACWGQDRIWRVEKEIARRAEGGQPA